MEKTIQFEYKGYPATVIIPENFNGQWIWKTEFLYAFDQAERALLAEGYARVYYGISDQYGSYRAVRRMHDFYRYVTEKFDLAKRCHLFGFSRGGLYAFNFALSYSEYVASVYLDAPVLDLKSWPPKSSPEETQLFAEYSLMPETLKTFRDNPVDNLPEFFALGLPLLVVAGGADDVVPFRENAGLLLDYCQRESIPVKSVVKPECGHHPHSLENVTSIVNFVKEHSYATAHG